MLMLMLLLMGKVTCSIEETAAETPDTPSPNGTLTMDAHRREEDEEEVEVLAAKVMADHL